MQLGNCTHLIRNSPYRGAPRAAIPCCLCARFCEPPSSPARLSPHPLLSNLFSVFSSLISSPNIYGDIYIPYGVEPWGGGGGERGGRKRKEGGGWIGQIKDRCWKTFFLDLELFAGSGYWEHENVKQTGKTKPTPFFSLFNPSILSKGFRIKRGLFTL